MDKETLRDVLFQRYFQEEQGILISDFTEKLSFVPQTWKKLHFLCEKNIRHFDFFSSLEKCKIIEQQSKKYFILKLRMWKYVIIDLDKMENISNNEFKRKFNEEFFINNFEEMKEEDAMIYSNLYHIERYEGSVQDLVNFYIEHQDILNLSTQLHYRLNVEDAWTWFHIDFAKGNVQMGFQTPDQFLYEQLFFKYDLTPWEMQDAQQKMGIQKMKEIFAKTKDIKIPFECIPEDLYQQYVIQCGTDVNKRMVKKL